MTQPLSAQGVVCRLLAGAWDRQSIALPQESDWPEALRLIELNDLGAMVYAMTRSERAAIPSAVEQALEQAFYWSATTSVRCLHQLSEAGQALARVGAPLLLLKGAALAEPLYGDAALRLMGDIDLAVPPEHVPACGKVLLELGYGAVQVEHRSGTRLADSNQEYFRPPLPNLAPLELHWHILDVPYYIRHVPMEWFWQNTERMEVDGQRFYTLNAEANLIYLPAHLALHHRFDRLRSLFDVALLIMRTGDRLDWPKVVGAARSFDLLSVLTATLDRLAECWPSLPLEQPREMLGRLRPSATDVRLFRLLTTEERSGTLDFYTALVSLPDTSARVRYAWYNLFPQEEYMTARYGIETRWHLPYWYLRRLAGGIYRFVANLPKARQIDRQAGPGHAGEQNGAP